MTSSMNHCTYMTIRIMRRYHHAVVLIFFESSFLRFVHVMFLFGQGCLNPDGANESYVLFYSRLLYLLIFNCTTSYEHRLDIC